MTGPFRCSSESRVFGDPMEGTASTVRSFLVVEFAGPWGVEALSDSRLDAEVKERLRTLEASTGIRPLLMRRPRRRGRAGTRVLAAHAAGQDPWTETALLADPRELLDVDLTPLADGRSLGLEVNEGPVFLVCTHGRHDACCAERGRPLYAAMGEEAPGLAWEVSHIGGDRFAPNVLVLPYGLYYGRLDAGDVPAFVGAHRAGLLDLDHLRGRSAYAFPVQVAEIHLRRHLGVAGVAPLPLVERSRSGRETLVVFAVEGDRWEVRVHTEPGEARQLTCSAPRPARPLVHRLIAIEPVAGRTGL